ncbi:MAG: SDR family oxidoreductase [Planctomycetes bacterium]|nr:SDR family oxidoreductase [Planctomycetota bacterium]
MNRPDPFEGQLWLVTGATSGIGAAIAERLARNGARLALAGRNQEAVEARAAELSLRSGAVARGFAVDLGRPGQARELATRVRSALGDPSGLVNAAGCSSFGPFLETPQDAIHGQVNVNLRSVMDLTHALVPDMRQRSFGHLLQVASVAGFQAVPQQSVYAATKAWLVSHGRALRHELRDSGVHCTTLCPGLTRTAFFEDASPAFLGKRVFRLGRWMEAHEVADHGLMAVLADRAIAIPGWSNRVAAGIQSLLPRAFVNQATAWVMR